MRRNSKSECRSSKCRVDDGSVEARGEDVTIIGLTPFTDLPLRKWNDDDASVGKRLGTCTAPVFGGERVTPGS